MEDAWRGRFNVRRDVGRPVSSAKTALGHHPAVVFVHAEMEVDAAVSGRSDTTSSILRVKI